MLVTYDKLCENKKDIAMNNTTDKQLLRDVSVPPTNDVLAVALGCAYAAYEKFIDLLGGFDIIAEWRYYNDGKAWLGKGLYKWKSARGTDKEKTVCWFSVFEGFFKVNFFIGESRWAELQGLPLSDKAKSIIANSKRMGKLKFFPLVFDVSSNDLLADFSKLIEFQKKSK